MTDPSDSIVLRFVARVFMLPLVYLAALYIIAHGEESPGGGFQGGAIMAAAIILTHLALGRRQAHRRFSTGVLRTLATLGLGLFMITGLVSVFTGARYLDYEALPIPGMEGAELRSLGVFIVEAGIALGVMGILALIFDHLTEPRDGNG